jgi:hypothetical protein
MEEHGRATAECSDNQSQRKHTMTFRRDEAEKRAQQRHVGCARSLS